MIARCLVLCVVASLQPKVSSAAEPDVEFKRPELVAIMWAPSGTLPFRGTPPAAWRSDGTLVPLEELDWLFESGNLTTRQLVSSRSRDIRPLILVFRLDDHGQRPHKLNATPLIDGKRAVNRNAVPGWLDATSTKDHLAAVRVLPDALARWPAELDLEVKTQAADSTVVQVVAPEKLEHWTIEKPLIVDRGVTWWFEPGVPRANGKVERPVGVLAIDAAVADPECDWSQEEGSSGGRPLLTGRINFEGDRIEFGCELPPGKPLEILRRRFRVERYQHVPLRLDLMPK